MQKYGEKNKRFRQHRIVLTFAATGRLFASASREMLPSPPLGKGVLDISNG